MITDKINPCQQVKCQIIKHLQGLCNGFTRPISQTQIRGILDVSGEPKDSCGIVVACDNEGEHWGMNSGGILIDVKPRICIYTHVNDDEDGSICNALINDVLTAMQTISYNLDGWKVMYNGNWQHGDFTLDGAFRQIEMSATLPLNRLF